MKNNHNLCALLGGSPVRKPGPPLLWPVITPADEKALLDALHSGTWGVNNHPGATSFEKRFADYCHTSFCITMCNGSVTLRNALLALGIEEGDEVIVPPYTFLATALSVVEANAIPVFADIEEKNWALSAEAVERVITDRTRGIIPVHLGGTPADMDALNRVAKKHGLFVLEDAAQAHGSEYKNRRVGSLGDMASFSFQSSKNLTCGEGGALTTNDQNLEMRSRCLHNCGRVYGAFCADYENFGSNYRLSSFQMALLNSQMDKLDTEIALRQKNAAKLEQLLIDFPGFQVVPEPDYVTRNCYHLVRMNYDAEAFDGLKRSRFIEAMQAEGIRCTNGYSVPLHHQTVIREKRFLSFSEKFSDRNYNDVSCPVAEKISGQTGVFLQQTNLLGDEEDLRDIVRAVQKVYDNRQALLKK